METRLNEDVWFTVKGFHETTNDDKALSKFAAWNESSFAANLLTMKRVSVRSRSRRPGSSLATERGGEPGNDEGEWKEQHDERACGAPPLEASMVCMAVVEDGPFIAFACYDEERNEIFLEALRASDDAEIIVERFIQTVRPNLVLVGNKIVNNPSFLEMITKPPPRLPGEQETNHDPYVLGGPNHAKGEIDPGTEPSTQSLPYRILKTGAFEIRACRALILQKLRVVSLLRQKAREHAIGYADPFRTQRQFPLAAAGACETYQPSSYHSMAAVVDFDSKVQVQALGALLSFLQRTVFRLEDNGIVTVNRIVLAKSFLYMNINASTLSALHIFSTEHHPLIAKGPGNAKEGFSLYSLLDRTQSKGGQQLLKEWMMKPLIDLEAIAERQDAVEFFMQTALQSTTGTLLTFLAKLGPLDKIITRMQKCSTQPMDFIVLTRTLAAAVTISNILQSDILPTLEASNDQRHRLLYKILERCNAPVLAELQQEIADVVDDELTFELKTSVVIRRGFHLELDEMKDQYDTLEDILEEVGAKIQRQHPELDLSVVFVPQVGFLVALDKSLILSNATELPRDFSHIFNQDDEAFFKTLEMRDLDDEIGDLHGLIKDTECMIVTDLEETLLHSEPELRESFKALSELDCILAFAECASDLKYVRPRMTEATNHRIYIKEGRHPLQEIVTQQAFVPNDTHINREERINVVTGPNFSGKVRTIKCQMSRDGLKMFSLKLQLKIILVVRNKSCYLRQVGVLVYLAHIGSFIPCQEAEISIVDQICARISAVETCAVPQSSFQLDLTEMAAILHRCTSRSLILIDEFGKGTSPASGIAILGAAVKKLATVGCKTVCTTHFLELFSMGVVEDGQNGIKARRMTIHLPQGEDDSATPLFKLEEGVASSSAGLICAKRAGVHPTIIARAKEIIQAMRDRRRIEPLPEAMPQGDDLGDSEVEMLHFFFSVQSWAHATDQQSRMLLQKLSLVEV